MPVIALIGPCVCFGSEFELALSLASRRHFEAGVASGGNEVHP